MGRSTKLLRLLAATSILLASSYAAVADDRFAIEGLTLGDTVNFGSQVYSDYRCESSSQFSGFLWCSRRVQAQNRNGQFTKNYTLAHDRDGRAEYINLSFDPAFFNPFEAYAEIQRLNSKFRETANVTNFQRRGGLPDSVIAVWGDIALEPLTPNAIGALAMGQSPNAGILIDFLGQLRESARRNLPIYRITGTAGYIWSASFDANGIGHLRLTAINPEALSGRAPVVATDPVPAPSSPPSGNSLSATDRIDVLERLGRLKASGVLNEDEFLREKQRILGE